MTIKEARERIGMRLEMEEDRVGLIIELMQTLKKTLAELDKFGLHLTVVDSAIIAVRTNEPLIPMTKEEIEEDISSAGRSNPEGYMCDGCGKTFAVKQALGAHRRFSKKRACKSKKRGIK